MRILWVSHLIPFPPKSGVHLRSYNLLRAVASRHEVDLVAFVQEAWLKVFYESCEEGLSVCERELRRLCRSAKFLPIASQLRWGGKWRTALAGLCLPTCYSMRWLQSAEARAAFRKIACDESYSLAHFDTLGLAPFRAVFGGVPATLGHHNIESHMLGRRAETESNPVKRMYFAQEARRVRKAERTVAGAFAAHITCSDLDSSRLQAIVPGVRAISIPNGVDTVYFSGNAAATAAPSLIFVGSLNWYPNVDAVQYLLREIWPRLRQRRTDVTLEIVGAAPPQSVRDLAAREEGVTVHGFVDDVRPMMERAAVYVCPVRDGGGTKLKLLDAFAMRKCVVCHPVACEGIDVLPGTHVELAEKPEEFVEVILRLLADPARRSKMGDAARRLVEERYSFEELGRRLSDAFEEIADTATCP